MIGELRTALAYLHEVRVKIEMHPPKRVMDRYVGEVSENLKLVEGRIERCLQILTSQHYRKDDKPL